MIYDISMNISNKMPVYDDDERVIINNKFTQMGDVSVSTSNIYMNSHTGTHIDAPRHFYPNGLSIDEIYPDIIIGKARVLEITGTRVITAEHLKPYDIKTSERILLKTDNSYINNLDYFCNDYVSLDSSAVKYLVEKGVLIVGIDYISIEKYNCDYSVHTSLLCSNIVILEGLVLTDIKTNENKTLDCELICLPLKVKGCDGSPARAVLRI